MIPQQPCDVPEACCVSLYDIAAHLLSETFDAVLDCYPTEGDCAPLAAYVTMGSGDDGIVDSLVVAAAGVDPSPNTRPGGFGLWRATFNVILRESGWPTAHVVNEQIVFPAPSDQVRAAQHVFAMGEAIHRRLAFLMANRQLVPPTVNCTNGTIGQMFPMNPLGGVVGWQVPVIVDLPWH